MIKGTAVEFLVSTWLTIAGLLVGLFEAFDVWDRSKAACVIAAIMFLIGGAGMAMTWKRAMWMGHHAAVLRRRRLGRDATLPSLHPLALGKLISEIDADEDSVKTGTNLRKTQKS